MNILGPTIPCALEIMCKAANKQKQQESKNRKTFDTTHTKRKKVKDINQQNNKQSSYLITQTNKTNKLIKSQFKLPHLPRQKENSTNKQNKTKQKKQNKIRQNKIIKTRTKKKQTETIDRIISEASASNDLFDKQNCSCIVPFYLLIIFDIQYSIHQLINVNINIIVKLVNPFIHCHND